MKILYVTDLHGDKNKYRKSLDIAVEKNIGVIVNGGDMLPKLGERHLEQPIFINEFLRDYFSELERYGITYLISCRWMGCLIQFAGNMKMFII